ncbi:MAG: right-handed parallel beta-helix repeat-containing protein [Actinomycetota bacterium]
MDGSWAGPRSVGPGAGAKARRRHGRRPARHVHGLLVALVLLAGVIEACTAGEQAPAGAAPVRVVDDEFSPAVVRIPPGGRLLFANRGRNPHNAVASDGSFSTVEVSGKEQIPARSRVVVRTPRRSGIVPFYCSFHGRPDGTGMTGLVVIGDVPENAVREALGRPTRAAQRVATGIVRRVPEDHASIQAAVDASGPGDLVLVGPGTWRESVRVTTPSITIRGLDRNRVVIDGEFRRANGVSVYEADGVALENLQARNHQLNGFYWTGVTGYRGSHLTAVNNADYGIYAFDATDGVITHSYASGSADAGFYIGQCSPCRTVVHDVVAENNAVGFSAVNAGGELYILGSVWRNNGNGIGLASLDTELDPPQTGATIAGNTVVGNNRAGVARPFTRLARGIGIVSAGGVSNLVLNNDVLGHETAGIVLAPMPDEHLWLAHGNVVRGNRVHDSGVADIVLVAPSGGRNCFAGNLFGTTQPPGLQALNACEGRMSIPLGWDLAGTSILLGRRAESAPSFTFLDVARGAPPPEQPQMPDARSAPALPAVGAFAGFSAVDLGHPESVAPPVSVAPGDVGPRRTVGGIPLSSAEPWQLFFGFYGYILPLALLAAWMALAFWDIARDEGRSRAARLAWLTAVLLLPVVGVVAYLLLAARLPAWFRTVLVAGGLLSYLVVLGAGALLGGIA